MYTENDEAMGCESCGDSIIVSYKPGHGFVCYDCMITVQEGQVRMSKYEAQVMNGMSLVDNLSTLTSNKDKRDAGRAILANMGQYSRLVSDESIVAWFDVFRNGYLNGLSFVNSLKKSELTVITDKWKSSIIHCIVNEPESEDCFYLSDSNDDELVGLSDMMYRVDDGEITSALSNYLFFGKTNDGQHLAVLHDKFVVMLKP